MNKLENFLREKTLWVSQGNHSNNRNTGNLNVIHIIGTTLIMVPTNSKYNINDRKLINVNESSRKVSIFLVRI